MKAVTSENFPQAFAAMDKAAKEFWTYPDEEWQDEFLIQWARENKDEDLANSLQ